MATRLEALPTATTKPQEQICVKARAVSKADCAPSNLREARLRVAPLIATLFLLTLCLQVLYLGRVPTISRIAEGLVARRRAAAALASVSTSRVLVASASQALGGTDTSGSGRTASGSDSIGRAGQSSSHGSIGGGLWSFLPMQMLLQMRTRAAPGDQATGPEVATEAGEGAEGSGADLSFFGVVGEGGVGVAGQVEYPVWHSRRVLVWTRSAPHRKALIQVAERVSSLVYHASIQDDESGVYTAGGDHKRAKSMLRRGG